jgi:5-methylcytosine-specific restriction endonuclease McrA
MKDGLSNWCKSCGREYKRAKNEHIVQYRKEWYKSNKKRMSQHNKEWYEANKEYKNHRNKEWYDANKERKLNYMRGYRQTDKGKLVHRLSEHNRRANKKYNTTSGDRLTTEQIVYLTEIYTECAYCNTPLTPDNTHLDHIHPLSKGGAHSIDNVTLACKDCNLRKNDKPLDQWLSGTGYSISIKHLVFNKLEERAQ